jgi:hypothetical protein
MAVVAAVAVALVALGACGSTMVTSKSTSSASTTKSAGSASKRTTASKPASTPTTTVPSTPPASSSRPSVWDRPNLAHAQTITITASNHNLKLSQSQNFILRCPKGPVTLPSKLVVWGGHNVELQNCNLHVTDPDWVGYLQDQTGTLWIHNVHFGGAHLTGGLQLQEPGATVVMRDVLFDKVYGSLHTNHAELIQTWCGPKRLLIDGLTGTTTYQGLFLLPNQWCSTRLSQFDLRHVDINDRDGAVALWIGDVNGGTSALPLSVSDVYVTPPVNRSWRGWWLEPQPPHQEWSSALAGSPPGGAYVKPTPSGATGVDEVSAPAALASELTQ